MCFLFTVVEVQKVTQDQLQVMDVIYPASDHPLSDKVQIVLPASLLIARKARGKYITNEQGSKVFHGKNFSQFGQR